ncbi:hypothetical protein MFIFM68171_08528 [Madurella fahalii]|uniref:Uncharacterized protein n=1 Tax=Madurella fahalii TaxID=1157608 RepID=A0ABQ0GKN0_9PEZI
MVRANGNPPVPEQLYHTTLTAVEFHKDTSCSTREVYVLGTHTTISAAKAFALEALMHMDYKPDDFAEAPTGHEFLVNLETRPNTESLPAGADDTYDERDDVNQAGEWPFGEEVVVHAVAQTGEHYTVAIKTPMDAYDKHRKI